MLIERISRIQNRKLFIIRLILILKSDEIFIYQLDFVSSCFSSLLIITLILLHCVDILFFFSCTSFNHRHAKD